MDCDTLKGRRTLYDSWLAIKSLKQLQLIARKYQVSIDLQVNGNPKRNRDRSIQQMTIDTTAKLTVLSKLCRTIIWPYSNPLTSIAVRRERVTCSPVCAKVSCMPTISICQIALYVAQLCHCHQGVSIHLQTQNAVDLFNDQAAAVYTRSSAAGYKIFFNTTTSSWVVFSPSAV